MGEKYEWLYDLQASVQNDIEFATFSIQVTNGIKKDCFVLLNTRFLSSALAYARTVIQPDVTFTGNYLTLGGYMPLLSCRQNLACWMPYIEMKINRILVETQIAS